MKSVLLCLLFSIVISARAQVSPIHMDIEQTQKTEAKSKTPAKGAPPSGKSQVRSLTIRLTNNSTETFDGLVVKYWFFGHAMGSHDVKPLKNGERKAPLGPRGKETVESESVSSSFTEAQPAKGKTPAVAASGEKLTGYAVQVMNGEKVMAESYSEPSYKQKLGEAAKQPAEAAKPKTK